MTVPNPEAPLQEEETSLLYHVSFDRLEQLNRSAVALLAARRSPGSPSLLEPDHELDNPQALVDEIVQYGSQEEEYINSNLPIQEIVFRTLLLGGNQPMSVGDLHHELTEKWSTPVRPINVSVQSLLRILDSDDYYGFAPVEAGE